MQVGYQPINLPMMDLASITMNQRQLQEQKRQAQQSQLMNAINTIVLAQQKQQELKQQQSQWEQEFGLKKEPQLNELLTMAMLAPTDELKSYYLNMYYNMAQQKYSSSQPSTQQPIQPNNFAFPSFSLRQNNPFTNQNLGGQVNIPDQFSLIKNKYGLE